MPMPKMRSCACLVLISFLTSVTALPSERPVDPLVLSSIQAAMSTLAGRSLRQLVQETRDFMPEKDAAFFDAKLKELGRAGDLPLDARVDQDTFIFKRDRQEIALRIVDLRQKRIQLAGREIQLGDSPSAEDSYQRMVEAFSGPRHRSALPSLIESAEADPSQMLGIIGTIGVVLGGPLLLLLQVLVVLGVLAIAALGIVWAIRKFHQRSLKDALTRCQSVASGSGTPEDRQAVLAVAGSLRRAGAQELSQCLIGKNLTIPQLQSTLGVAAEKSAQGNWNLPKSSGSGAR
jgi:hypothetical protein